MSKVIKVIKFIKFIKCYSAGYYLPQISQMNTDFKVSNIKLGLLINFNTVDLKKKSNDLCCNL